MNRIQLQSLLFALLTFLCVGCSSSGGGTTGTGGYDYTGSVLDESGSPISGADVVLRDANGLEVASTRTDDSGHFSIPDTGINSGSLLVALPDGAREEVAVSFPQDTNSVRVNFTRERGGGVKKDIEYKHQPKTDDDNDDADDDKANGGKGDDTDSDSEDGSSDDDPDAKPGQGNGGNGHGNGGNSNSDKDKEGKGGGNSNNGNGNSDGRGPNNE